MKAVCYLLMKFMRLTGLNLTKLCHWEAIKITLRHRIVKKISILYRIAKVANP